MGNGVITILSEEFEHPSRSYYRGYRGSKMYELQYSPMAQRLEEFS
jgi:hypothetical protein